MKTPIHTLTAALAALTPMLFPGNAEAALVSYLALDTSTGLTLNNGAAITSGSQGKFGEALLLDGVDDYAVVNSSPGVSGGGERTVSAWVYQDLGSTGLRSPLALGTNVSGKKWDLDIDNSAGGVEVGVNGGRNAGTGLTSSDLTGKWILVTSTLPTGGNLGSVKTYLDGAVTNAAVVSTKAIDTTDEALYHLGISANLNIQYLDGRIDDVSIWNEALTAAEIKGMYDVGMSVPLSYTAGDFDLLRQRHDLGSGATPIDSLEWTYATGLTGPVGLTSGPGGYTLVLDAVAGTGLTAVPEPSAALLGGLGLLALFRRRR